MAPMSPQLSIDVNADHSCNWRCCFGKECPAQTDERPIPPPNSPTHGTKRQISLGSDSTTTEKVEFVSVQVVHKFRRGSHPPHSQK